MQHNAAYVAFAERLNQISLTAFWPRGRDPLLKAFYVALPDPSFMRDVGLEKLMRAAAAFLHSDGVNRTLPLKAANTPFVLETVPDPVPGPGEAVARVLACGSGLTIQHYKSGRTPSTIGVDRSREHGTSVTRQWWNGS